MVMRKHQRYFPLYKPGSQELLPHFITIANGRIDVPTVKVLSPLLFNTAFDVIVVQFGLQSVGFCLCGPQERFACLSCTCYGSCQCAVAIALPCGVVQCPWLLAILASLLCLPSCCQLGKICCKSV